MPKKKMKLTKVNITGHKYFHVFDVTGVKTKILTTADDYTQLASVDHKDPTDPLGTWRYSFEENLYDTPSGSLENEQYAEENKQKIACIDEIIYTGVEKNHIDINGDGTLDLDYLEKIVNYAKKWQ